MEGIYEVSSSEKVRTLEEDLRKELKELQHEIEEGSHLDSGSQRTFGSVPLPKDVDHFRRERKLAINKALQVREAQPLVVHADVMQEEMEGAMRYEYTAKSLPLLLHQFYNDRISQLVQCKHMHMLRWARFCEHTKAIENLYSAYQKRLSHIMEEYHDALQRARRLAAAAEATLAESDSAMQSVTVEDLMFYTRWLVCYMHSVKTIHAFLRVIEWLPTMHKDTIKPHMTDKANVSEVKSSQPPTKVHGNLKRVLSHVSLMAHLQVLRPQTTSAENVPPPPPLSLSPYQLVSAKSPSLAAAAAASGGGLASDEINLGLPLHGTAKENFKPVLEFLMNCYAVDMEINQLNTHADEMELFTIVCRRFKKVFFKQEQLRTFPTYDASIEELGDSKIRSEGVLHTFKQQSNWLKFVQLRAEKDSDQVKTMTKLKQENNIDELLKAHSKFLHVEDGQRVMSALKEHAKAVMEPPEPRPVSVTTHRTSTDTVAVWKRIFSYASSRDDVLEFQAKLTDEDMGGSGSASGEFELGTAVELLGLDDEEAKSQAHVLQGAYMAYLLLRHLRLRDLQRTCLSILNYFRSVERTLTINDGGLSLEGGTQKSNRQQVYHGGGVIGIGSHQYIHNTPADYKLEQTEFMEFSEIENHDDFYSMEEGRVHVQDQKGYYVMYDSGLADFKKVEQEMLLIATHYIQTDKEFRQPRGLKFKGDQLNISSYGHQPVDRFGVLLDLWTNEAAYLENKRQLLDCYLEAYYHVFDSKEKRELAQVITNIIHQRPRFDFTASYFVKTYRAECVCLRLHCNLIKNILDQQIDQERAYNQKVSREDSSVRFGLPHRVIPQQHISINTSRPALKYIYMLEFHPSLALASRVLQSLKHAFKVLMELHKPKTTTEVISMEISLFEVAQKEWNNMEPTGHQFSPQVQKDLFSEVFIEDPLFVCEVGQSLITAEESKKGGRKSQKEKQKILANTWSRLLEVITLRHRLIMACQETEVVTKAYKSRAKEIGFDEYHIYLRSVSFDYAQSKPEADLKPPVFNITHDDDSRIDRYTPAHVPLAIQELDENHVGSFSFRTRESFLQVMSGMGAEKLQTVLMAQVVHKNLIISALMQLNHCAKIASATNERAEEQTRSGLLTPGGSSHNTSFSSRPPSAETERTHLAAFSSKRVDRELERKLQEAFVSVQLEKTFWRDKMLNNYLVKKAQLGTVLKNIEEVIKLKKKLLTDFCSNLHKKVTQFALQAQIIAYTISLVKLMRDFPSTRNAHFMFGEEDEKKNEEDDCISPDPKQFKLRPRRVLSQDGKKLLNLWFIPHYTEVLTMHGKLKLDARNAALHVTLRLISSLHDICQYLCAHARLGSSHARLGSQKLEFSGVTADWGGTEGIGAELREIQRQINHLEIPDDPYEVADFLARRRDNMFLEFDVSISHSVRDTFLSTGNESAYTSITDNMHFALQDLSNLLRTNIYSLFLTIPEPLNPTDALTKQLYPWRSFLARHGPYPMQYCLWDEIGCNLQLCLAGLRSVDRHVVNGEILGVSLLLEDVLQRGLPDNFFAMQSEDSTSVASVTSRTRPATSTSRKAVSKHTSHGSLEDGEAFQINSSDLEIPKGPLSFNTNPQAAVRLINKFLLICSRLELLKTDYGCRKLGVNEVATTKHYKAFCKIYKIDILQPVYQQVAVKHGQGQEYAALGALVSDDEPLSTPPGATEMELKVKQVLRLLENLECTMIHDVIRRISREHTLVVSERGRDDATLPTDLWKKPVMKENCTIPKPHLVENFVQDLMSQLEDDQEENLIISRDHLNKCLLKLASETMLRERNAYDSYAMFYENLLRNQHQLLYIKEQENKQLKDVIEAKKTATIVDVHCQLADRSHEQLLEITALRAKLAEMRETIMNQEKDLRERIKNDFAKLVEELFTNSFMMRTRFEEFRLTLYDDVHEGLSDVRRQAVEDMKKMREKSGTFKEEAEAESSLLLTKSEQIRLYQEENKNLGQLFLKMKTMHNWKRTRLYDRYHDSVAGLREEADKAKRECIDVKEMADQREILLKQEQAALRNALAEVERECQKLRKKLQYEQKAKMQKTHAQLQEAYSQRQLELAKSNNIDKLIADLEEKELRLRMLTENLDRDQKKNWFAQEKSKKTMKQMMQQLEHERHLKLDAFERVEELQMQIYDYEQQLTEMMSQPASTSGYYSDKRPFTSFATRSQSPHVLPRAKTVMSGQNNSKQTNGKTSGGVWPPPVWLPGRLSTSPDQGTSRSGSPQSRMQRPKANSGRLRNKIAEGLVGDAAEPENTGNRLVPI